MLDMKLLKQRSQDALETSFVVLVLFYSKEQTPDDPERSTTRSSSAV